MAGGDNALARQQYEAAEVAFATAQDERGVLEVDWKKKQVERDGKEELKKPAKEQALDKKNDKKNDKKDDDKHDRKQELCEEYLSNVQSWDEGIRGRERGGGVFVFSSVLLYGVCRLLPVYDRG